MNLSRGVRDITVSTKEVIIDGPTGDAQFGAVVSVIPVAGDAAGPGQHFFLPGRSVEDGMELALRTLRELPQNQGLKEEFYPRTEQAV